MDRFDYGEDPIHCIDCFAPSHPDKFHEGEECPRDDRHAVCPVCGYCQECHDHLDIIKDEIEEEDL